MNFSSVTLEELKSNPLDTFEFGVVKVDHAGKVTDYNSVEAQHTGVSRKEALGKNFFTEVAPCTNNFMIAERFKEEAILDASMAYFFTFKLEPTLITLRLIKDPEEQYLLVNW